MSTNLEYSARERQGKRESRRQASETQREKGRQRSRARHKKQRRREKNENTYDISSIKKFLEVSRYCSAKQRQRNKQKKRAVRAKLLFY